MKQLEEFKAELHNKNAQEIVLWALETFGHQRVKLASSFSVEDQVLTDMAVKTGKKCKVFTLDTGRHFEETYRVWQKSIEFWSISYEVGAPDPLELQQLIGKEGPNLFYDSVSLRKTCCAVRKTHPLKKLLSNVDAWIVGLRSEQSVTRAGLSPVEWDDVNGIYRISPLHNWSELETMQYVIENKLPVSELISKGFRSIGCAPCTRAIGPEEDIRAGRWWWEEPEHKECGLHNRPNTENGK